MRFYLDTEFIEAGRARPLELISIGIVAEDGRELYLENAECDLSTANDWVKANVLPHLQGGDARATIAEIADAIRDFIPPDWTDAGAAYQTPEVWGYFADYDWVIFCQVFGTMMDLPKGYPMCCLDLRQLAFHRDVPKSALPKQEGVEHNALADARWNRVVYDFLSRRHP